MVPKGVGGGRSGSHVDGLATKPLPSGSPALQTGDEQWPTNGRIGYITPAIPGVHNASKRRRKSAGAHKWVDSQHEL